MEEIDISGIDKAELLAALVNGTQSVGMGRLQDNGPITIEQARGWLDESMTLSFDYVAGRPIKTDISGDTARVRLYDRDAGEGTFACVVAELRKAQK